MAMAGCCGLPLPRTLPHLAPTGLRAAPRGTRGTCGRIAAMSFHCRDSICQRGDKRRRRSHSGPDSIPSTPGMKLRCLSVRQPVHLGLMHDWLRQL
jgi:hypothetical protein